MVLHHVAQRARLVVISAAPFDAERLGDGDLHMVDMRVVPHRLEQRVGEAQRHQVLHRFLAEIMIDAEDRRFGKDAADRVVDRGGADAVATDRLLNDDARALRGQTVRADPLGDRTKQVGAGRKIIGARAFVGAERRLQAIPTGVAGDVDGEIVETGEEALDPLCAASVLGCELGHRFPDARLERSAVERAARDADDARRFAELIVHLAMKESRIELAIGQGRRCRRKRRDRTVRLWSVSGPWIVSLRLAGLLTQGHGAARVTASRRRRRGRAASRRFGQRVLE